MCSNIYAYKKERASKQTVRQLDTNAHANFPLAEHAAYQCIENGESKICQH